MELGGQKAPCLLVKVTKWHQDYANMRRQYFKQGLFLNLVTGNTFIVTLDDTGVRGEIVRGKQEKKGDPQPSEGLSSREGS